MKKPPKFKTALVIDDDEIDLFLAEKILKGGNYCENIIIYSNAKFALSYLDNINDPDEIPDIIFLDLSMPAFSGEDFLINYHKVLSDEFRGKIKLVVLTAYKDFHTTKGINKWRFPSLAKIMEKPLEVEDMEEV